VTPSILADHCSGTLRRLGLGGMRDLIDVNCEDIARCAGLEWLELRACARISDTGVKQIGLLAGRQSRARAGWSAEEGAGKSPPPALTHLDLGGVGRLSDEGLGKLLSRAVHIRTLDLRGCSSLTADGQARALLGQTISGVPTTVSQSPPLPDLGRVTLSACCPGADDLRRLFVRCRPNVTLFPKGEA